MTTDLSGPSRRKHITLVATAAAVFAVDLATKITASAALADRDIDLPGPLDLRLSHNPGVAFGMGNDTPTWLVLTLTDSALVLGLVSTLGSLPILLFTLIGGVVADRVNKRKFVMLLQGLMLTEALTLGILTAFGWITVPMIIVLAVFFGTLTAFEVPTRQAFVVDVVGKDDLVNAIALNSSAFNLARVIGPTIAGVTIAAVGIAACFFLNAASYVAVLAGLAAMKLEPGEAPEKRQMRSALREGFAYVLGEKWPRTLIFLTATMSVFGYSFIIMLPVLARDELGVGAAGYDVSLCHDDIS